MVSRAPTMSSPSNLAHIVCYYLPLLQGESNPALTVHPHALFCAITLIADTPTRPDDNPNAAPREGAADIGHKGERPKEAAPSPRPLG